MSEKRKNRVLSIKTSRGSQNPVWNKGFTPSIVQHFWKEMQMQLEAFEEVGDGTL